MTRSYSVAEARAALPEVIKEAKNGKIVQITKRGKPEAVVISLEEYQRLSSPRPDFLTLYDNWRKDVDLENLLPEPNYFEKLRDKSPGPPPCFEE